MENCKNCGHSIQEDHKYCPECGQKNRDKLRFKVLLGELASTFLSWDSKFFKTIVPLITKPGHVSKEYLGGKRKSYVAPLRLFLFFSFLFFFTLSVLQSTTIQMGSSNETEISDSLQADRDTVRMSIGFNDDFAIHKDSLRTLIENDQLDNIPEIRDEESAFQKKLWKKMLIAAVDGGEFLGTYFQKNISVMFFFFLPVFGLLIWVFFANNKMDYIEHLVYGIYFHSFFFFMLWFTLILSELIGDPIPLLLGVIYMIIYLVMGIKRFYEAKVGVAILKSVFLSVVYLIFFIIALFITLLISVMLF